VRQSDCVGPRVMSRSFDEVCLLGRQCVRGVRRMMGFRARSVWLGGVILLVVMLVSLPGLAETETEAAAEGEVVSIESAGLLPIPDYSGDIWTRSHLTGDWGEVRSHLASKGVQAEIRWNQTVQSVVDGGRNEDTDYGGSLNYDLILDLMRMGVLPGALIRFRAESRYGDSINSATGSILPANLDGLFPLTSPIDDDFLPITVTSLNYTQFLSEHFAVTVGKFDTLDGDPNEFAGGRGVSQFLNSNFIFNPSLALIVPYSTLGFGIIILPNPHLTVTRPHDQYFGRIGIHRLWRHRRWRDLVDGSPASISARKSTGRRESRGKPYGTHPVPRL